MTAKTDTISTRVEGIRPAVPAANSSDANTNALHTDIAAAKSLRDIIHDDLTHAQQQHHADAINFADLVIAKAGGGA